MTGMLFANVLGDDPADLLMQGVNSCSYVGKDKVGRHAGPSHEVQSGWIRLGIVGRSRREAIYSENGPNRREPRRQDDHDRDLQELEARWRDRQRTFTFSAPNGVKKVDELRGRRGEVNRFDAKAANPGG